MADVSVVLLAGYSLLVWDQVAHGIDTDAVITQRVERKGDAVDLYLDFTTQGGRQVSGTSAMATL